MWAFVREGESAGKELWGLKEVSPVIRKAEIPEAVDSEDRQSMTTCSYCRALQCTMDSCARSVGVLT